MNAKKTNTTTAKKATRAAAPKVIRTPGFRLDGSKVVYVAKLVATTKDGSKGYERNFSKLDRARRHYRRFVKLGCSVKALAPNGRALKLA